MNQCKEKRLKEQLLLLQGWRNETRSKSGKIAFFLSLSQCWGASTFFHRLQLSLKKDLPALAPSKNAQLLAPVPNIGLSNLLCKMLFDYNNYSTYFSIGFIQVYWQIVECKSILYCIECTIDMIIIDRQIIRNFWSHKIA